ncbi:MULTISPECIES: GGDEF domain-containing protein [unclassified Nocardioides]|uniref:GGDEF domain-containing protein n=1 Tax=unclassified Nocardioides TaxID=2615069 RepID=UPI0007031094|nr:MULTISPECIES: GGDEF domain-containing protein [unclassified Nocardioides]
MEWAGPVGEAAYGADAFTAAARRVVDYLSRATPLETWSVSRVAGGEQVHVHVRDSELITTGQRVDWQDSFCRRMTTGAAHVVVDSAADPDYAPLPAAQDVRAYVGYPIADENGELFGILCGVGDTPLADADAVDPVLVEMLSGLLSTQLVVSRAADREVRAAQVAAAQSDTDALTGLTSRRGWDLFVDDAQRRIDAFGDLVAVAVVDLDGLKLVNDTAGHAAGDELIRRAGRGLRAAAGRQDRVARYGGDEFAILTNNVPVTDLDRHYARFVEALAGEGVRASLGHAWTGPGTATVADAFERADAAMYAVKRSRAGLRTAAPSPGR